MYVAGIVLRALVNVGVMERGRVSIGTCRMLAMMEGVRWVFGLVVCSYWLAWGFSLLCVRSRR